MCVKVGKLGLLGKYFGNRFLKGLFHDLLVTLEHRPLGCTLSSCQCMHLTEGEICGTLVICIYDPGSHTLHNF